MRSPQALRNGDAASLHHPQIQAPIPPHFQSTVVVQKLRRFNSLIFVFRLAAFCFSLAASVFMLTNSRGSDSPYWNDFDAFSYPEYTRLLPCPSQHGPPRVEHLVVSEGGPVLEYICKALDLPPLINFVAPNTFFEAKEFDGIAESF